MSFHRHFLNSTVSAVPRKTGFVRSALVSLGLLALAACQTTSSVDASANDRLREADERGIDGKFPAINPEEIRYNTRSDVFRIGDRAIVTMFGEDDVSGKYLVTRSGNISVPLVGRIKARGLTTEELQDNLTEEFAESYFRDPTVSVDREAADFGKIIVDGEVERPGVFEIDKIISLSEAVAMAQGTTRLADTETVYMIREINEKRVVRVADLQSIRRSSAYDPQIIPGDIVYVERSGSKAFYDEFLRTVPLISTFLIYGGFNN